MKRIITPARGRALAGLAALALALALVLTGTLAWQFNSDHKTNEAGAGLRRYDARLVEDFREKQRWSVSDPPLLKRVSVVNKGRLPDEYYSVYVRVTLKEYMEFSGVQYVETPQRYMIGGDLPQPGWNGKGNFITFETAAEAAEAYPGHAISAGVLTDIISGDSGYMVLTQAGDINGQYGRFVVAGIVEGEAESLIPGVRRAVTAVTTDHNAISNGECAYTPLNLADGENPFRAYVGLGTGQIVPLSEFENPAGNNGAPMAKWIYNDRDLADPYIYWGQFLTPGEDTALLLESLRLLRQPAGAFYYAMHVDMDAVSIDELMGEACAWDGPGDTIPEAVKASYLRYVPGIGAQEQTVNLGDGVRFGYTVYGSGNGRPWLKFVLVDGAPVEFAAQAQGDAFIADLALPLPEGVYKVTLILNSGDRAEFTLRVAEEKPEATIPPA